MERPLESLKSFATRLATVAASDGGMEMARLLRISGLFGNAPQAAIQTHAEPRAGARDRSEAEASTNSDRVGIWERKEEDGAVCFVRRLDMLTDWHWWANVGRIEPKGRKRRVVLIGESVARGYLYDPEFTPAMALEFVLQAKLGKDAVEVIDLARTNLSFFEGRTLAISALRLDPDAVVMFSGNNWVSSFMPEASETSSVDSALRERGIVGLKDYIERGTARIVRKLVDDLSSIYKSKGIPLIWIVPEFNLGDWRDAIANAPHPYGSDRGWISCWEGAKSALQDGDVESASELANTMLRLDQGVSAAAFYILADCSQRDGDLDAVRLYLEKARDVAIWDPSWVISPRPYSVVQESLREQTRLCRDEVVDAPKLLEEYLNGGLPDRRIFLDYCHLTTEGIQVVMAAVASRILRLFKGTDVPWRALLGEQLSPAPQAEGQAAFLAAVHNAHYFQSYDLVRYYCSRAIQLWPPIAGVMSHYIDLQTRRAPMSLCKSAERIAELQSPLMQRYLLHYNFKQLDPVLLDAIIESLKQDGTEAKQKLDHLRRQEHSVAYRDTDLLDYYYCSAALQPQELMWVSDVDVRRKLADYYQAFRPESRFVFVGEAGRAVKLRLTCRLPRDAETQDTMSVALNGRRQAEMVIDRAWRTWDLVVFSEVVREGLNEISIRWPLPDLPREQAPGLALAYLSEKKRPEFFCIFGEIHSFTACDAENSSARASVSGWQSVPPFA
jgi:hypothetical protein